MRRDRAWCDEGGSVLLLVPVGLLIVLVLGALAVDLAVVYLGERQAVNLAAALANDAASVLDDAAFYGGADDPGGALRIDDERARRLVAGRVELEDDPTRFDVVSWRLTRLSDTEVEVVIEAEVPLVFARALPGSPVQRVDAVARARAAPGP